MAIKNIPGRDVSGFAPAVQAQRLAALEEAQIDLTTIPAMQASVDAMQIAVNQMQAALTLDEALTLAYRNTEPINLVVAYGFKGDGTFADTEIFQNVIRIAYQTSRPIYVPPGIYYLHHPVTVIASVIIFGWGHGTTSTGTEFRPAQNFDLTYNKDPITHVALTPNPVKPAMFQGQTAPDPTGANRWNYSAGMVWHDAMLKGLTIRNYYDNDPTHHVTGLNGISIYYPGENSLIQDLWVEDFETNYQILGTCATFTSMLCTTWGATDIAWRFEKHPNFAGNGGIARVFFTSGDRNTPSIIGWTGNHDLVFDSLKCEWPINASDNVLRVDVSPEVVGSGGCYRGMFELRTPCIALAGGSNSGFITNLVKILHTGTSAPAEYPEPCIVLDGGTYNGILNTISDETNGVTIPTSQTGTGDPRVRFTYCRGIYEQAISYIGGGHQFLGGPTKFASFAVSSLPSAVTFDGRHAYATNGRKLGEGPGAGTGVPVYASAGSWRRLSDDSPVAA